jgi:hypothetical protein
MKFIQGRSEVRRSLKKPLKAIGSAIGQDNDYV